MVIIVKNILNYYYGIIVSEIFDNGYFSYNNHLFCLYEYKRSIEEAKILFILNNYMLGERVHINRIILNNYHDVLTYVDGKYYVLLLINYRYSKGYFNFYLAPSSSEFDILKRNNWASLWSAKVDYVEYQIKHLDNTFPMLFSNVNYYIGLSENAISYFKMISLNNENLYISHRRISKNDLYNPIEIVIDYKVRDIGEYIKNTFIKKEKTLYEIKKFINNLNLSNIDYLLLYTRLLYPSYYFDMYDKIINNNLEEEKIKEITVMSSDYEELLFEVYLLIKRKLNILGIEWINNKFM